MVSYAGFVNGDTEASLTSAAAASTTATASSPVGTYAITAGGASSPNYSISYADGTLTVTQASLIVTADDKSKTYGSANPTLTVSYGGFVNGDTETVLTTAPTVTTTAVIGSPVGTYPIAASGAAASNYAITYADGTMSVTAASLTITADDKSKTYGSANPALTVSYSGFVNGDTETVLTAAPTVTTTAVIGSPVGTYPIAASGAAASNYAITYADGTMSVTAASLTITADDKSKTYGSANPALTVSYSGFVNGDTETVLTTAPIVATTAVTGSPVGTYPIAASGAAAPNYAITYADGTMSVTAASLTITADDKNKIYGSANPALTVSYAGFVNGDTEAVLTTAPTVATTAVIGSPMGSYPIAASGAAAPNYAITYADGTMSVTAASLTITADDKSKIYGSANPALTVSYSGFVNGDTEASLTTAAVASTTATASSPVGTYVITAGGASSANYSISYADGTLTVTQASLIVTADDKSKVYGSANPTLTVSYSGFVNGDTEASLTSAAAASTTATASSPAGTYAITAGGASSPNYSISYADGILTVTQASLIVTADNKSKTYGSANPTLTVSYSGFVNGDTEASLTTAATASTLATTSSPAGTYAITASGASSPNYSISYVDGILTITPSSPLSNDADLKNLSISNGILNPVFSANTLLYNVTVGSEISAEMITAVADDPLAVIRINGVLVASGTSSNPISLELGLNVIVIKVVAEDGSTVKNYTINVTREASNNAALSNLMISEGNLEPVFESDVTQYNAKVKYDVNSITVTPTAADPKAAIKVNGSSVASATASEPIVLATGENIIETVVTAQDGITKQMYTITVFKGAAPDQVVANNILSPNGDGKNDYWEIKDIVYYPNNIVTVYDRAGRIVYSKKAYSNEWDGAYKGSPLNNDTYYYLIDLGDDLPKIKGFITIIRD
nr:MBG domain-containing protein [Flavobacterium nitrogenifigens]